MRYNLTVEPKKRGRVIVSEIRVGKDESIESALKRFKRKCQNSGIIAEVRRREHYEKPSVRRKTKALAARKKAKKYK
jgi:small subunit ribosomal protein S21